MQPFHGLEETATSKTFPLSIEIAVNTPSADENHVSSTETPTSVVCSIQRSLPVACIGYTFLRHSFG